MKKDNDEIIRLRQKLLDVEDIMYRIKTVNDLFAPFADENCPQGTIVAGLISKQLEELESVVKF